MEKSGRKNGFRLAMSVLGLACMALFRFIPPYESITSVGWAVIGDFAGAVVLWTFVDLVWPFFPLVVFFGLDALKIYPASAQSSGVYEACAQSLGNWIPVFVVGCLVFCVVLEDAGVLRRISYFFLSRKFARRNGWTFSLFLLLSGFIPVLFLDVAPVQLFFFAVCEDIFAAFGFKKGDDWPRFITTALAFILEIGFVTTPICHTLVMLWMGVYAGITGTEASILQYTAVALPIGLALIALMLLYFRFVVRPDMSRFESVDWSVLDRMDPGPRTKREKLVTGVLAVCLACWIVPGVVSLFAPESAFADFMTNRLTQIGPLFFAIAFLCIVRVDGKPLLDLAPTLGRIQWSTVFLLASFTLIANAIAQDACGISAFLTGVFAPLVSGLSPWVVTACAGTLCVVLVSFMNQVPVGIIVMNVAIPLCPALGINPLVMAITVCLGSAMAFTVPPSCLPIGIAYGCGWSRGGYIFKNGAVSAAMAVGLIWLCCWPLGTALFG